MNEPDNDHFWWVIVLEILLVLSVIILSVHYRRGKKVGIQDIEAEEGYVNLRIP